MTIGTILVYLIIGAAFSALAVKMAPEEMARCPFGYGGGLVVFTLAWPPLLLLATVAFLAHASRGAP